MWRPWENNFIDSDRPSVNNNQVQDKNNAQEKEPYNTRGSGSQTLSKQCLQLISNVYDYVRENNFGRGSVTETAKAVKLSRQTVSRIVNRGPRAPKKHATKRRRFEKIDNFTCDLIRREIYRFYDKGQSPTSQEILIKLQQTCEFPYKETHLRELLKKLRLRFHTLDKRHTIMESARIVAWRYRYLNRINQLRANGYKCIFLDETWFDTHDVVKKDWDDGCCSCTLKDPCLVVKEL